VLEQKCLFALCSQITEFNIPVLKHMDVTSEYFLNLIPIGLPRMRVLTLPFKANIVPHPITKIKAEPSVTSVQPEFVPLRALIIPQLGFKEDILKQSRGVQHPASRFSS